MLPDLKCLEKIGANRRRHLLFRLNIPRAERNRPQGLITYAAGVQFGLAYQAGLAYAQHF
ncbi:MAG: hypothetical protein COB40_01040 [Marinosulfonomonas sp.]|nr:MAG: hypothetical protein COB40_01040 [Marinosulfonomonas sp.]